MNFNVEEELREFEWRDAEWTDGRLRACSPFREDDHRPSFYVWLRDDPQNDSKAGYWGDSGGYEYQRGGFFRLLAFLREETEEETREYLREKYGDGREEDVPDELTLKPLVVEEKTKRRSLDLEILKPYQFRHPYLAKRGISERTQREMGVGYDRKRKAIVIPWFLPNGELGNVKYRKVDSKSFWYQRGGMPIRDMVYGMDIVKRKDAKEAVLVEAEIDAMTVKELRMSGVAVGGAKISDRQAEIIANSSLEKIIIATDNDQAGVGLRGQVVEKLRGYMELAIVHLPDGCKDVNEVGAGEELRRCIEGAESVEALKIPI
ncbi:toprim domain-containing protein [Mechercharimyces sp. CAU 1602]|uniref:toprim domain-containing protein n=1 Tax=Mechercharimyces sp. CAU 1602 TaxID=2973933 RepID=UPI0021619A9A|nr:toprim domain-containing protein [Mechercharimyces sp. CAU 1602]MCS1350350.1 toprim domain-containing protein [Mechercharimyces sp. CAU 1602]